MNISFLFNSDDERFGGYYGEPIKRLVFKTGLLQSSQRHMKVSVGDVLIYGRPNFQELSERTYFSGRWSLLHEERLRSTFHVATVYAMTFENMTVVLAQALNSALVRDQSYLGCMEVDYSYGPHLVLFRNSMITKYRIKGKTCRIFFVMGEEDGKDENELDSFKSFGFNDIDWEDRGGHGTIFDDFDTLEHFEQVALFKDTIASKIKGGVDGASELVMVLEDLNPRLFNVLGSAVKALRRAKNEEDVAQASMSGRRYLEKLADVLFSAKNGKYKGREVGQQQYRNRIWAYLSNNISVNSSNLKALGNELDRLDSEFNAGIHGDRVADRIMGALVDVSSFSAAVLALNPSAARKPYFAFEKSIASFINECAESDDE